MSVDEAQAIEAGAGETGRLFTMGFQMRQEGSKRALRRFVADGGLGEIYHSRVWGGHIMAYPWGRFHHRKEESLGGVMAATVVHPLDALYWILGAPEPVTVSASYFRRLDRMPSPPIHFEGTPADVTVEDFAHAHVRFADDSSMSVEGNWLFHPRRQHGFEINGVLGIVQDVEPYVELENGEEVFAHDLELGEEPADRTVAEHEEFVAAIRGEGAPIVSLREAVGVQRILCGIYESAELGKEVMV
jgi:predicted dehydrogenase